jgi:hypothetical protein
MIRRKNPKLRILNKKIKSNSNLRELRMRSKPMKNYFQNQKVKKKNKKTVKIKQKMCREIKQKILRIKIRKH